jgi:hypothetical protein
MGVDLNHKSVDQDRRIQLVEEGSHGLIDTGAASKPPGGTEVERHCLLLLGSVHVLDHRQYAMLYNNQYTILLVADWTRPCTITFNRSQKIANIK